MQTEKNSVDRFANWLTTSVTLKLVAITILMLLLLIPSSMVQSIIKDREQMNNQAIKEVSSKWAGKQQLNGPILSIPLIYKTKDKAGTSSVIEYWHILPEDLKIDGKVVSEQLKRGIYEVVVYKSDVSITGSFQLPEPPKINDLQEIQSEQAFLTMGVSDLRGIKNQLQVQWGDRQLSVKPGSQISKMVASGITMDKLNITSSTQEIPFQFKLHLQGSQKLSFTPIGNTTQVRLKSNWKSPSFSGNFLPDDREITPDGFTASWSVLQLNRNFPQSWIGDTTGRKMKHSAFGVDLILPLDDYQKSYRSVKYAVMTIALTFLIFFLVEILNKRKIHPFQYALVGLALCLFYVLLVSISEHTNFNLSYAISTAGIVTMIGLYSISVFKSKKMTMILTAVLLGIYGFLFTTIQLQDYALLMGSIGLTLILALTMYFTRNINWYQLNKEPK